jgi:hypothetical protein
LRVIELGRGRYIAVGRLLTDIKPGICWRRRCWRKGIILRLRRAKVVFMEMRLKIPMMVIWLVQRSWWRGL